MTKETKYISDLSQSILKLWNEGDMTVLQERFAPDFERHDRFHGDVIGRDGMAEHVHILRTQYPDLKITVHDLVYDGQTFVSHWRFQGTDLGDPGQRPVPPTKKPVDFNGVSIYHFDGDHLVDEQVYYDLLIVMQQLGVVPESAV